MRAGSEGGGGSSSSERLARRCSKISSAEVRVVRSAREVICMRILYPTTLGL